MDRFRGKLVLRYVLPAVLVILALMSGSAAYAADGGRVLKMRTSITLPSLDWEQTTTTINMKVWHQMFEGLYGMDEAHGGYYNELAKEVKISDDQLTYTITLIDGVTFQNGDPLKASDVVFSYNRARKNSRFNYLTSMIEDVKAVDGKTVEFKLNTPYSPIAHTFFCIKITSEREVTERGGNYGTVPHKAGTGPYYVTEYNVATGLKMKAYEGYWRGAPTIKDVEYVVIGDESAAVIAFQNHEIDYFEDVPMTDWDFVAEAAGDHSRLLKGNNIITFNINYLSPTNNNILGNSKIREAIFYAVNKADINIAACDGRGVEAYQYMPDNYVPTSPKEGFKTYEYNPEKAKELLAEAGYPDGVDVGTILTYGDVTAIKAVTAQVIQANLAEVGITAQVSVMETAVVTPKLYAQDYDLCIFSDYGNFDYNNIRQQVHSESTGMYVVRYKDDKSPFDWKRIEELVDLGVGTADVQKRLGYYTELWKIVSDTATILPCVHYAVGVVWSGGLDIGDPVPTYYKIRNFKWL
jgi:peptide/nickel transport system substrate-binding protein